MLNRRRLAVATIAIALTVSGSLRAQIARTNAAPRHVPRRAVRPER